MGCNCQWTETIIGLVVIVFSVLVNAAWAKWVVFVAGVALIIHAWKCKNCGIKMPEAKSSTSRRRRK